MANQQPVWREGRWRLPFFTIWGGQALSLVGSRVAMFALIWWITDETGSATVLALATLFALLPQIVLGPLAGVLVDRWNRRAVMIVADGAIAGVSLWLALLFWSGAIQIWHVYVIMLARELGGIFHWPAMQSSTSLMVPKEHLARVSGLNQAMHGALNIIGPALGALLLAALDIYAIMLIDVATAAFAIAPLLFIAVPQPARQPAKNGDAQPAKGSMRAELGDALRYLLHWRGLMWLTALAMIAKIALTPAFSLFPLLVTDHFGGGASELALGESLVGVGVVVGGLTLGVWGGFKRNIHTMFLGIFAVSGAMLFLGLVPGSAFALGVVLMFVLGMAVSFTDGPLFAVMQSTVAPEMQGRVFMLFGSLITLTSPVGLLVAGPVTDLIGVQALYFIAGALLLGVGVSSAFIPSVQRIEDYAAEIQAAAEAVAPDSTPAPEAA